MALGERAAQALQVPNVFAQPHFALKLRYRFRRGDHAITDAAHLGLMLSALALTYLVPFELLLLAYVVLGPAHYATEISWLHDRKYFLPQRGIALGLALVAFVAAMIDNATWFGFVMWSAFVVCVLLAATTTAMQGMVLFIAAIALTALMLSHGASLAVLGILLPTLIHVSLFTHGVHGARRLPLGRQGAMGSARALCRGGRADPDRAAVCRHARSRHSTRPAQDYFANVAPALGRLFGIPGSAARYAAREPARLRLHLSLPQLVHQSRDDPLEPDVEGAARARRGGECGVDRALFL